MYTSCSAWKFKRWYYHWLSWKTTYFSEVVIASHQMFGILSEYFWMYLTLFSMWLFHFCLLITWAFSNKPIYSSDISVFVSYSSTPMFSFPVYFHFLSISHYFWFCKLLYFHCTPHYLNCYHAHFSTFPLRKIHQEKIWRHFWIGKSWQDEKIIACRFT